MLDSYQATKQPPQPALSDVSVAFDTNFVRLFSNPSSCINIDNIFCFIAGNADKKRVILFILKLFLVVLPPKI